MTGGSGIDPALLEIVVCPDCRSALEVGPVATTGAAATAGAAPGGVEMTCQGCGLVYPVRDGIPVLLVDEAVRR